MREQRPREPRPRAGVPVSAAGDAITRLLSTVTALETTRGSVDGEAVADGPQLLSALTELRYVREQLAHWEPTLIAAARDRGVTWTELAPALGVASRQAAESRYLRLKQHDLEPHTGTGEQRMQATRDRRSGDRAVAVWARNNAAALRTLAGQISALPESSEQAAGALDHDGVQLISQVSNALGSEDAADLVGPLLEAHSTLSTTHPQLAERVANLALSAQQVRTADLNRRKSPEPPPTT